MKRKTLHLLSSRSTPTQYIAECDRLELELPQPGYAYDFGYVARERARFTTERDRVTCAHCLRAMRKKKH